MAITRRPLLLVIGAVALLPRWAAAQQSVVTGRVTSDAGVPLTYAEVRIPELSLGALTRENGTYSIVVPGARVAGQQVTITARVLGYKVQSVQITISPGTVTQDFTLIANPLQLGEIVVTGAGTVTQAEKLGSVRNHVDSGLIQRSDEMNFVEALAGKAPNVEVVSQAGDPGASSFIRIRGANTINGDGQPLIVVDGMPIDNSTTVTGENLNGLFSNVGGTVSQNRGADVNPSDIASIEILKGPSAAAIYGARAGQGVVLITTKSGAPGATRTTSRSELLVSDVTQGVPLQTRYGQGLNGLPPAGTTGEPPVCTQRAVLGTTTCVLTSATWGPELPAGTPVYNHFDELFTTGFVTDNNLTVSGGNDKTLFYISGEYMHNWGTMHGPNNNWQRATTRLKASQQLLSNLTIGANVAYADTRGGFIQRGSNISGLLLGALRTPPEFNNWDYIDPVTGLQRSYRYPLPAVLSTGVSRGYDNPVFTLYNDPSTSKVGRVYGGVNASYLPFGWLNVSEQLGLDYSADERVSALAQTSSNSAHILGQVLSADYKHLQIDQNLVATATYKVSPTFNGTVSLGQGLNSRTVRAFEVQGNDLIAPQPYNLLNTVDRLPANDNQTYVHTQSFFGQATADLYSQLYLTGAARRDGSSTFGASERWHWFPKGSAAWEFTKAVNEGHGVGALTYGKVRGAYGQSGAEPAAYQTINSFTTAALGDDGWGPALTPTQAGRGGVYSGSVKGQENLKPERTKEFETGADLAFFKGERIDAHYTYYNQTSSDVIFLLPLSPSSGFQFQAQNAATIKNFGHEVTVNLRPIQTADLNWNIGLQWAKNTNRVTELRGAAFVGIIGGGFTDPQGAVFAPDSVTGQQYPVGELRGSDFVRCGRGSNVSGYGFVDDSAGMCLGAPKGAVFLGSNGFPLKDSQFWPMADPTPKWTGSAQTSLRYKKWTVSGLLDVKHGGQMWNGTKGALLFFGTSAATLNRGDSLTFGTDYYQQYTFAGPGVGKKVLIGQSWYRGVGSSFSGAASQVVEDAGYVKLREIAIAYTLDQPWVRNTFGFDAIDVRVSGRNLKTWTNYTGIDPESSLFGADVAQQGFDYFSTPQTRSFTFSITLHH